MPSPVYGEMPSHLKTCTSCHTPSMGIRAELFGNSCSSISERQHATNTNTDRHKLTCHHCKKPGYYKNQCPLKRRGNQFPGTRNSSGNKSSGANNSILFINKNSISKKNNRPQPRPKTLYSLCQTCEKTNHTTEKCCFGRNAAT